MKQICSIKECDGTVVCKGWCNKHYQRWARHGDPLAGRTFEGDPQKFLDVSIPNHKSDECLLWPYRRNEKGYGTIVVGGIPRRVARIVCERIHGAPPSTTHEAAHKCGNSSCVNERHFRWATPKSNQSDRWEHGTEPRGEKNPCSKLTEDNVRQIRNLLGKESHKAIASRFNVSDTAIRHVATGKNWGWLDTVGEAS